MEKGINSAHISELLQQEADATWHHASFESRNKRETISHDCKTFPFLLVCFTQTLEQ